MTEQPSQLDETAAGSDQVRAKPYCGLKNQPDQVDYLNPIVQLLYHNDIFRRYVRQHLPLGVMHASMRKLFYQMDAMASTSAHDVHSTLLKQEPQFHKNEAKYEAKQLFVALVGVMQKEANQVNKQRGNEQSVTPLESGNMSASQAWDYYCESVNKSDLATLMGSQVETSLACLACGQQSASWNVSCLVQVNFPQNETYSIYCSTLKRFLDNQSAKQTLNADCVKCEKAQQSSKRSFISRNPPLLVFHLARLSPRSQPSSDVNRELVVINERIQLDTDHYYNLTSAVLMKKTSEATVYWTLVRDAAQQKWTSLVGDRVKEISLCDAKQQLDSFGYLFAFSQVAIRHSVQRLQTYESQSPPVDRADGDGHYDDDDDDDGHSITDDD